MITRLKVHGFKNLLDVDLRLGPFTCIAGANAVGKSNLFDAITFLSLLADKPLHEAALRVRSEGQRSSDLRDIFFHHAAGFLDTMDFEVEMIIPNHGFDDLRQPVEASITSLRYHLTLKYREKDGLIELVREDLMPIPLREARSEIGFPATKAWKDSAIHGRKSSPFISTDFTSSAGATIKLHQDKVQGGTLNRLAYTVPKTILSTVDTNQYPTALLVRNEMRSWKLLQLETSSLRKSDEFHQITNASISSTGENMAATVFRIQKESEEDIYQQLSNRVTKLLDAPVNIEVDKDEKRELVTLQMSTQGGAVFPARSLSDGTLRLLGLAVVDMDHRSGSVICLEEPENGIHPGKIEQVLDLLQEMPTDTEYPLDNDNPLRQVIINTHSPIVVQNVNHESLLVAEVKSRALDKTAVVATHFSPLPNTWRSKSQPEVKPVLLGKLLSYLGDPTGALIHSVQPGKRVKDREDITAQIPIW